MINERIIYLDSGVYSSGSAMSDHDYEQLYPLTLLTANELAKMKITFRVYNNARRETYKTKTFVIREGNGNSWYSLELYLAWFMNLSISKSGITNHTY